MPIADLRSAIGITRTHLPIRIVEQQGWGQEVGEPSCSAGCSEEGGTSLQGVWESTRSNINAATRVQKQKERSCSRKELSTCPWTRAASIAAPTPSVIQRNCSSYLPGAERKEMKMRVKSQ